MDGVDATSVVQDALGQGGLPTVNVCRDSDVPHVRQEGPILVLDARWQCRISSCRCYVQATEAGKQASSSGALGSRRMQAWCAPCRGEQPAGHAQHN